MDEDSGSTPLNLDLGSATTNLGVEESEEISVKINETPSNALGSVTLADGTEVQPGKIYSKAEAEGIEFKPSANAEGSTELDLTIQVGTKESTPEGEILTSEEVKMKEVENLEDLNNDGTTGVNLSQEVFNPNASPKNTQ